MCVEVRVGVNDNMPQLKGTTKKKFISQNNYFVLILEIYLQIHPNCDFKNLFMQH